MTRIVLLLLGAFAAVTFAAFIIVAIPKFEIPAAPNVATESSLKPYSKSESKGRSVYISNGCIYCHSQQVRDPTFSNDVDRGWGRPSYPSDYIYDTPVLLGTMRTGPDLINVGLRLPDRNWHLLHLYQPRALNSWSIMPSFPFLFVLKDEAGPNDVVVKVPPKYAIQGKVVVASEDAINLVNYLLSLRRDVPPPELKNQNIQEGQK